MTILITVFILISIALNGFMLCVMFKDFAGWMCKRHYNRNGDFNTVWFDLETFFRKF